MQFAKQHVIVDVVLKTTSTSFQADIRSENGVYMTIKDLKIFLKEHMVPNKFYSLNGNHKNRICLEKSQAGWEIYFSDKKDKVGLLLFHSEDDACLRMKDELRKLMEQVYGLTWKNSLI